MKLDIKDRIVLLNLLPQEGSLTTIRQLRELREALSFSDDDHAAANMREDDGKVLWEHDVSKDIPVSARMKTLIADEFDALDKAGRFRDAMLETYEKFQVTE